MLQVWPGLQCMVDWELWVCSRVTRNDGEVHKVLYLPLLILLLRNEKLMKVLWKLLAGLVGSSRQQCAATGTSCWLEAGRLAHKHNPPRMHQVRHALAK